MYEDLRKLVKRRGYTSVSEVIRDTLRDELYPEVTENGFTPEFEEKVLKAAAEPRKNDIVWDGKGSFTKFVLREGKKRYGKD